MHIKAAYPYRAHWDEQHMTEDDLAGLGRRRWGSKGGGSRGGRRGSHQTVDREEAIARARRMLASAREGTRILVGQMTGEVTLEAFSDQDWRFVLGVCDATIRAQYEDSRAPFTPEVKHARASLDAFTKRVFDSYRPWPPLEGVASGKRKAVDPLPAHATHAPHATHTAHAAHAGASREVADPRGVGATHGGGVGDNTVVDAEEK